MSTTTSQHNAVQRWHDHHPIRADLVLIILLVVLIYGAVWFNLPQFWMTDLRTGLSTSQVTP